ncbi:MAG: type VI secretion system tube protein Hcp [Candidatus Thiosymbion ectosymbiont of Robbea hypermnestra]|nr:type VI secretion system tube protein Hcp [Candidatus Thiosymbion ectosymbiont of Robbea hypermnestra]
MAVDMYLCIEGVKGESTDAKHPDCIEVLSYNFGVTQPVSAASATGGRTAGKADPQDLSIVKTLDTASPDLYLKGVNGETIKKATLKVCLATGEKHTFMEYTFTDCIVSSVSVGGSEADETKPLENITFNYGTAELEYTAIDHDGKKAGTTSRGWNYEKNSELE